MARYKDINTGKIYEVDEDGTKRVIYDPEVDAHAAAVARQKFLINSVLIIVFLLMCSFAVMYRTSMIRAEKADAQRRYTAEVERKKHEEELKRASAEASKRAAEARQASEKGKPQPAAGDSTATPAPADSTNAGNADGNATPAADSGEMDSSSERNADVEAENYQPDFAAWADESSEENADGEKRPPRRVEDMFKSDPNNPSQSIADADNPTAVEDNNFLYRIWTGKEGGKVNAKLVGVSKGRITLANMWGEPRTFKWDDFSRHDIKYVRSLGFLKSGKRLPPDQRKPFKEDEDEDEDEDEEEEEDEDVNDPARKDYYTLTTVIDAEDIPKLQELFKAGNLKVNTKNGKGDTVLLYAITYHSDNFELIKCIVEEGKVDVYAKNKQGISPLKRAQEKENTELCIFLQKHGAEE